MLMKYRILIAALAASLVLPGVASAADPVPPGAPPPTYGVASAAFSDADGVLFNPSTSALTVDHWDFSDLAADEVTSAFLAGGLNARAVTSPGVNRAEALANVPGSTGATAVGVSVWYDGFVPLPPTGLPGPGTASVSVTISGSTLQTDPSASIAYTLFKLSQAQFDAIDRSNPSTFALNVLNGAMAGYLRPIDVAATHVDGAGVINRTHTGTFDFTYGDTFYLVGALVTRASDLGSASSFNTATFGFSTGNPADTLFTDSYVPYASFVPEPGTWALTFGGLALIGLTARRRRR
jgi:hypothetical protein